MTGLRTPLSKARSPKLESVVEIVDRDDFDDFGWDCDDFDNLGRNRDDFDDRDDFDSGSSSDGIARLRSLRFADVSGRGDGGVGVDVSMVGIGGA